jgi:hypothetical protein
MGVERQNGSDLAIIKEFKVPNSLSCSVNISSGRLRHVAPPPASDLQRCNAIRSACADRANPGALSVRRVASIRVTLKTAESGLVGSYSNARAQLRGQTKTKSATPALLPRSTQHSSKCAKQNLHILAKRAGRIIVAIKLHTFPVIRGVPTGHLPEPCDPGT